MLAWVRVLKAYFQDHYADVLKAFFFFSSLCHIQSPGDLDQGCTVFVDFDQISAKDVPGLLLYLSFC